jgi:ubiquinone/menaquinone biosynthesis C-methylase UbiE
MIDIGPRDRVLHLGFGDGAATLDFARRAASGLALGVDPSDDRVRAARKLAVDVENVMFVLGSHEEVPWQGDFFSVVVSDAPAADWTRAAREIFRVAASGARLHVNNPPPDGEAVFQAAGFVEVRRKGLVLVAHKPGL